jgi:arylsulfatase A-like enzyme
MRPNILLVVFDTARRDAFEPYGAPDGSTSALRHLAARGQAVAGAYATASWTLPSHASMFTGMLPRQLEVMQAPGGTLRAAHPLTAVVDRLLPEVLRRAGYTTEAWSANLWVSPLAGFDVGFERFHDLSLGARERMSAVLGDGLRGWLAWLGRGLRATADDGAAAIGDGLRTAIAAWSGKPAFWFVNLVECHSPYLPPQPWNDLPAGARARAVVEAKRHLSFEAICRYVAGADTIPRTAMERMHHLHRRAAAYLDAWLAGILDALDARGLLDETLVIVTSDHGENFGEAGLIAHGFGLGEPLIHVPLILAGPGAPAAPVDGVFSLAQIPRLIARAAGLDPDPWEDSDQPAGVAVSQYDPMGRPKDPAMVDAARRWKLEPAGIERITARYTAATDGVHKLVVRNGQELIYDLRSDPGELAPLAAGSANGALAGLRAAIERAGGTEGTIRPESPAAIAGTVSAEQLELVERQMKLLGYM